MNIFTRPFFMLFIPIAWVVISRVHFRFPGDEYAMWAISSFVGTWPLFFIQVGDINTPWIFWMVAICGGLVMAGAGSLLARLRTPVWLWLVLFLAASVGWLVIMLERYPNMERALAKNGSWWAYILSSCLMGMYSAWVLSLFGALLMRARRQRGKFNPCAPG